MDPGVASGREDAASERVYRKLMRAYPEEVRRRYADEMVGYFGDLCRDERLEGGFGGMVLLWARALPELLFTALQERGTVFRRNAYLPVGPRMVARWGALCALVGGSLGMAFHVIEYSLLGALGHLMGGPYISDPLTRFFTSTMLLSALSLSSLGLFGLYGAIVARSDRPGLLAGAGAVFSAASAFLWLSISGYGVVHNLASGTALFVPLEWLWYAGSALLPLAFASWFLGFLTLGMAAALGRRLPTRLRVLPLALFAFMALSYEFGGWFETVGSPVVSVVVMGIGQGLPFAGVALLGWIVLKDHDAEPVAISGSPTKDAGTPRPEGLTAVGPRRAAHEAAPAREKELLRAIRRHGQLTVAGAALETSLSVEEADRMLSELAVKGHLEVQVERGRLLYSLWESHR